MTKTASPPLNASQARPDIFVIGASAGGIQALQKLLGDLPAGFPGTLLIVVHLSPRTRSYLPAVLGAASRLPVKNPEDGERIEQGRVYVAFPDRHLVVERDHVHLSAGPKEQHNRPCINVLFRSAALAYGERVAGVVLTGELDDGTAGLWEVKRRGGIAIVQNPEEAPFPSMPLSALREVEADYVVGISAMGELFLRLASYAGEHKRAEVEGAKVEPQLTDLTCPDCRGTIWEMSLGKGKEFRCRVGHTFSPKVMLSEHSAAQEKALYAAVVALEEGASLATRLADKFESPLRDRLRTEARERQSQAETILKILKERSSFSLDE